MVDPLSLFGTILAVVQLIGMAAKKMWDSKSQGKHKCLELAGRAKDLAVVLHEVPHAAVNDMATAGVQQRLKDALDEAFRLINYCQKGGVFAAKYCCRKVAELDNVDKTISKCILDLMFISQARGHSSSMVPAVHGNNYYYNQATGGASIACVGWPAPAPQHAGSTSQASDQPPCVGWPLPVQYPALGYGRPTTPWDHGAPDSFSVQNSKMDGYRYSATTSGTKLECCEELDRKKEEQLQEHSLVGARAEEEAAVDRVMVASLAAARAQEVVNRVMEESLASARAEEAALNLAGEESLSSARPVVEDILASERAEEEAAAIRLVDDFVASTRASDEAAVNRGLEEFLATAHAQDKEAVVNRPLEDSVALTGAEEEATVNRVVEESLALARAEEESLALLRVEDMVRALCASLNLDEC